MNFDVQCVDIFVEIFLRQLVRITLPFARPPQYRANTSISSSGVFGAETEVCIPGSSELIGASSMLSTFSAPKRVEHNLLINDISIYGRGLRLLIVSLSVRPSEIRTWIPLDGKNEYYKKKKPSHGVFISSGLSYYSEYVGNEWFRGY